MKKISLLIFTALTLIGCTHASISSIPRHIEGVGDVYYYQGRANFAHQIAEADRMIMEHCKKVNGGKPVIVNHQKRDLGVVAMGSDQSTTNINATATGSPYSTNISGTANTTSSSSMSGLRNFNQEIMFKCVTE